MRFTQTNYQVLFWHRNVLLKKGITQMLLKQDLPYEDHKKYLKDVEEKIYHSFMFSF